MKVHFQTDAGRVRLNNEDYALVNPEIGLLVIADGMGGHSGGEIASAIAASSVNSFLQQNLNNGHSAIDLLIRALTNANEAS